MTDASAPILAPISGRRRATDRIWRGLLGLATLIALVPLVAVVGYLLYRGLPAWSGSFFTSDPTGSFLGDPGGVQSAIVGTIEIVLLASVIAIPIGIGLALYLTEYGREGVFPGAVRYVIDVMTGVPSIVFGLFVYTTLVLSGIGGAYAGWKGAVALALLMLPVVARSAEVVLLLVPGSLREAALALGAPRFRVIARVVLPTAAPGLLTGALLAIARGAGETAPLIFTVFGAQLTTYDLGGPINALPLQIFGDVKNPRPEVVDRAWGAALCLVAMILLLTLIARLVARRSRLR